MPGRLESHGPLGHFQGLVQIAILLGQTVSEEVQRFGMIGLGGNHQAHDLAGRQLFADSLQGQTLFVEQVGIRG